MRNYFRFNNMAVEEAIVLKFPFSDELPSGITLTGTPTVTVEQIGGVTDPSPSTLVVNVMPGTAVIDVAIDAQIKDADYEIRVTSDTTDPLLRLTRVGRIYVF